MKQAPDRSIVGEFEDVSLGDKRLERRLGLIAQAMESAPGDSLVEQAGDVAALEATYRFFSNERVSPEAIFEVHAAKTAARAQRTTHRSWSSTTRRSFASEVQRSEKGLDA